MAKLIINGQEKSYKDGTKLIDIAREHQDEYADDIVLALYKGNLSELHKTVSGVGTLEFITTADRNGRKAYRRSVIFLMQRALMDLYPDNVRLRVLHGIGHGNYCLLEGASDYNTEESLQWLKKSMLDLVDQDLPLRKYSVKTNQAREMFSDSNMIEKELLLKYRTSSNINLYDLDGCIDYFYGYMVPSTGYLKYFDLQPYEDGFMLLFPRNNRQDIPKIEGSGKHFREQMEAVKFGNTMKVPTVGSLNEAIAQGRIQDIILSQEAIMERRIGNLARSIAEDKRIKFVMMAGPSSSGKTTFSHKLSAHLRAMGLTPHPIPLDDFYLDHDLMPVDEFGQKDFEALECLDVELFNDLMSRLLKGEKVQLPTFNFKTGKREYDDRRIMQLKENDILVIEGIHGLNDKMSASLPDESKFKIFLSPMTQLAIDEHNPLSASDGRLIRRIVRDARTRGTCAAETIAMWDSVLRGEEKNIFPFMDSADCMFNTAIIYEMAVLKLYAQPLLYGIPSDDPTYVEAKRLIKLLDYFLPLAPDDIPNNSLVREFIGGSCLKL